MRSSGTFRCWRSQRLGWPCLPFWRDVPAPRGTRNQRASVPLISRASTAAVSHATSAGLLFLRSRSGAPPVSRSTPQAWRRHWEGIWSRLGCHRFTLCWLHEFGHALGLHDLYWFGLGRGSVIDAVERGELHTATPVEDIDYVRDVYRNHTPQALPRQRRERTSLGS